MSISGSVFGLRICILNLFCAGLWVAVLTATSPGLAIVINFGAASGYTVGNLLEGQPSSGTQWVRSGNTGSTDAAFEITSSGGNNVATAQPSTGTITYSQYNFSPSSADLGGTFVSGSSVINYSFTMTYNSTPNTTATIISRWGTGSNLSNFDIQFYSNGQIYVGAGTSAWMMTTTGGSTHFTATANTPIAVSGQINFSTKTFTISINGISQTVSGNANFAFGTSASATPVIAMQVQQATSATWLSTSVGNIQYALVLAGTPYNVTVLQGGLRQTYQGFGAAQGHSWDAIPTATRQSMAAMVYGGLHANAVRFDMPMVRGSNIFGDTPAVFYTGAQVISNFQNLFVNEDGAGINVFNEIQAQAPGVTTMVLMPDTQGAPTPGTDGAVYYQTGDDISMSQYAYGLAQAVQYVRSQYPSITLVTGIVNEPTNSHCDWQPSDIVECIDDLKADLATLNVTNVQVLAPETGNVTLSNNIILQSIHDDPDGAWNDLFALANHDYGWGTTDDQEVLSEGKPYWITESSNYNYIEATEDGPLASDDCARLLNDLNHSVTEWLWWIGVNSNADVTQATDTSSDMLIYDIKTAQMVEPHLKYYYFEQLLNAIEPGAVIRRCRSATEGDMVYTRQNGDEEDVSGNIYPAMNATAAVNPDGSWAICLVNNASGLDQYHQAATNYSVTVTVEELANVPSMNFTVYTSEPGVHNQELGTVTMTNGVVTLPVSSTECVTLKSGAVTMVTPPAPTGLQVFSQSSGDPQATLNWNMTGQAATWTVKRATASAGPYSQIATGLTTTSYNDTTVANGTTYYYEVAASNAKGTSAYCSAVSTTPMPSPWSDADIGSTSPAGSGSFSDNGVFSISGGGSHTGITSGATDACNYFSQSVSGDQTIIARVVREFVAGSGFVTFAGVDMRSDIGAGAPDVSVTVYDYLQTVKVDMCVRTTLAGNTKVAYNPVISVPAQLDGADPIQWVKLVRSGSSFTGYYSTDGVTWNSCGTAVTVTMTDPIKTGLIVSNEYNPPVLTNAIFDSVKITSP